MEYIQSACFIGLDNGFKAGAGLKLSVLRLMHHLLSTKTSHALINVHIRHR